MKWIPLRERLPSGGDSVLLFSPYMHLDRDFPGHPVVVSNPGFVRQNAIKQGYTYWCEIPYPLPLDASVVDDWSDWEWRYYWSEEDKPPERPRVTIRQRIDRFIRLIRYCLN